MVVEQETRMPPCSLDHAGLTAQSFAGRCWMAMRCGSTDGDGSCRAAIDERLTTFAPRSTLMDRSTDRE